MLSDEEGEDNEDYVPASLAAFLEQADQALDEQTKMFLDEISPSPTPNPDQSGESADHELSNLDRLQTDMANISILDRPHSILSTRSDDSAFHSPAPRNPAADLTFSAMDTPTQLSTAEEKKSPHGQSEAAEDSVKSPSTQAEEQEPRPNATESSPANGSFETPSTATGNQGGIDGPEVASPNLEGETLKGDPHVLGAPQEIASEDSHKYPSGDNVASHQEKKGDTYVDASLRVSGAGVLNAEVNRNESLGLGTPKSANSGSHAETDQNESLGLGTPTSIKSEFNAALDREDPLGLGTPGSIASSAANDDDSLKSVESKEGAANGSHQTLGAAAEETKEVAEAAANSNGEGEKNFPPDVVTTVTNDKEPGQEGPQPEGRSLFGAFASFARSVVPTNKAPSPEKALTTTTTKSDSQEVSAELQVAIPSGEGMPPVFDTKLEQPNTTSVAMSTEPVNTEDEIMEDTAPPSGDKDSNNPEEMQAENEVEDSNRVNAMQAEATSTPVGNLMLQIGPSYSQGSEAKEAGRFSSSTTKTTPPKATTLISPSSRLVQPTASRLNASTVSPPKTAGPHVSPSSRLVQPTASRKRQVAGAASKGSVSTPSPRVASGGRPLSSGKRPTPTRIPLPSVTRSTAASKRSASTTAEATATTSRFMQPTASKRAHTADSNKDSRKRAAGNKTSQLPSRLMRGTATSTANDDAVARARERVRLRKLQESKQAFQSNDAKFNIGSKPKGKPKTPRDTASKGSNSPRFATATTAAKAHQQASTVSMAQSAVFFGRALRDDSSQPARNVKRTGKTTPRLPSRLLKGTAASNAHEAPKVAPKSRDARKIQKTPVLSMAQCTDLFGKGLRGDSSPGSKASRSPGRLTVPEAPKFATSAKYGSSSRHASPATTVSLAQSTNLLANTLRGNDPTPVSRGTRPRLTRPESPKFHKTHKRALPKSSAEIEADQLRKFRAQPFKANPKGSNTGANANQKALHTGSSTGLQKVTKRTLTKPEPFHLSSGGSARSTRMKYTTPSQSPPSTTTQFRARPLPASSASSDARRTLTAPKPFSFAVDMKSKTGRERSAGNRSSPQKKLFKARPLPKSTFKNPSIPVHNLTSPANVQKKEVSSSSKRVLWPSDTKELLLLLQLLSHLNHPPHQNHSS